MIRMDKLDMPPTLHRALAQDAVAHLCRIYFEQQPDQEVFPPEPDGIPVEYMTTKELDDAEDFFIQAIEEANDAHPRRIHEQRVFVQAVAIERYHNPR